jgi:hypothetical protein
MKIAMSVILFNRVVLKGVVLLKMKERGSLLAR